VCTFVPKSVRTNGKKRPNASDGFSARGSGSNDPFVGNFRLRDLAQRRDVFPPTRMATLLYCEHFTMTTNAVSVDTSSEQDFRANSVYDPDSTGLGHQPMYFDQLAAIYKQYIVHKCEIEVEFHNPTADGMVVGLAFGPNSHTSLTVSELMERPNCVLTTVSNSGEQRVVLKVLVDMEDLFGITKQQYLNEVSTYGAAVTANPTTVGTIRMIYTHPTTLTVQCQALVRLRYLVQFFSRNTVSQS